MDALAKGMSLDRSFLIVGLVSTETVEKARTIHDTYPTASAAFGRVISGALLLASLLKEEQKVVLQIKGEGPLREATAEADWRCRVRGYVRRPHIHLELKEGKLDVGRAFGRGFLYVIKDLGLKEYYTGSVPLQTGEVGDDLAYYFRTSEQIPAVVSLGVYVDTDNSVKASGGFMIHALPGVTDEMLDYLEQRMKNVQPVSSMILNGFGPRELMREVVGLPFDVIEEKEVTFYCPCNKERVLDAVVSLGPQEIMELVAREETIAIECQFCKAEYTVTRDELLTLLSPQGVSKT